MPKIDFTDNHINAVAKAYYQDEHFGMDSLQKSISLWKLFNLFTSANKNSYIDNFLNRSLNATDLTDGINKALHGDAEYRWFIE